MAAEDLITIIAEDTDAEAAAEAEAQLQPHENDEAAGARGSGGGGSALESLMQFDKSQRTPSQQQALPLGERARPSLAQGALGPDSGRKSSVRMSTQLLMPQSRQRKPPAGSNSGSQSSGRPGSPRLDSYLDEVPQPSRPRFSSSMSLEAQFAMMKAYESRLRRKILSTNPEFANVLHVSPDPPVEMKRPTVSLKQRPQTSRESAALAAAAATEAGAGVGGGVGDGSKRKAQRSQSLAPERSQISEETQLDLARRLQYAQYLSDYFVIKQGEPCLNYSLLRDKKDFNPIKKFNWWSSWWSRDFEFQEEPERRVASSRGHQDV